MEGIRARADVFDEQILRHILSFVPGSSELAAQYSLQPETGHYLVKAGWPVVLKKNVSLEGGRHHHLYLQLCR